MPRRLRSEAEPDPGRSARVIAAKAIARQRRAAIDAEFRAALLAELGQDVSATTMALVNAAVSANTEIVEISRQFLACSVGEEAMTRLGAARGQLARILRALGLPRRVADKNGARGGSALERYLASRSQPEQAKAAGLEGDADGQC